jgi:hypothetical protein
MPSFTVLPSLAVNGRPIRRDPSRSHTITLPSRLALNSVRPSGLIPGPHTALA